MPASAERRRKALSGRVATRKVSELARLALALVVASAPASVLAQSEGGQPLGEAAPPVAVTALIIPDDTAGLADVTRVGTALRRGLAEVDGIRFVHAVDALPAAAIPEEVTAGIEELEVIAGLLRSGNPRDAARRIEAVVAIFDMNLAFVRRAQLADAYMLHALAACAERDEARCRAGLERVVVFREAAEYDATRYPAGRRRFFTQVRDELVAGGVRGSIEVRTTPPGAEIYVDGRSLGPSPVVVDNLLVGEHFVTIKAFGFVEEMHRVTVNETFAELLERTLERDDRALLVENDIGAIRAEAGQPRAGDATYRVRTAVDAQQLVVATLGIQETNARVAVSLYDFRTRHRLSQVDRTVPNTAEGIATLETLGPELYRGVDLRGIVEAPDEVVEEDAPLLERWYFWAGFGAAVAISLTTVIAIAASGGGPDVPEGFTRFEGTIE